MRKKSPSPRTPAFDDRLWARRLVERRLRADVGTARRAAPAGLKTRAMNDLDRVSREPVVAAIGRGSFAYATAAGLLLLVAVLAWTDRSETAPPTEPAIAHADRVVMPVIEIDPVPLRSAIERRAERLRAPWSKPLLAEARLVMADAERAADTMLARLPGRPIRLSRSVFDDVDTVRPAVDAGDDEPDRPRAFPWNRLALP